jgi:putative ABC transport system permease protein
MPWKDTLRISLEGLQAHTARTLLTALGIIFGVAAVIAMLSIGEGAREQALRKYASLGVHNILVRKARRTSEELDADRAHFSRGLDRRDVSALRAVVPPGVLVSPQCEQKRNAKYRDRMREITVVGVQPDYFSIFARAASSGTILGAGHMVEGLRVCVLSHSIKRELFDFDPAVGESVKLGSEWFRVIGVLPSRTSDREATNKLADRDVEFDIYVPLPTMLLRFPRAFPQPELDQITLRVEQSAALAPTANLVRRLLQRRHHGVDDFALILPEQLLEAEQADQRLFNAVLAAIAGISLLVGGIGIMNIMLATVQERVKEIGLRRAVGATAADVVAQFITEAALLSVGGGLIGVVLGITMAHSIDLFADFSAIVSAGSVFIAFGVSLVVGLVFGIYPARRAAALDPIEALHHE